MSKFIKRELLTKEANDLKNMCFSVDYLFNKLRIRAGRDLSFEEESFWKHTFNEKVLLYIDDFLEEMSEEISVPYKKSMQIETLKQIINKSIDN